MTENHPPPSNPDLTPTKTGGLWLAVLVLGALAGATLGCSTASSPDTGLQTPGSSDVTFTGEAWADNWFAMYLGDALLVEDSVPITTERSFNAERFNFSARYPFVLSFVLKDFKANDSGLEYIGQPNQQIGDGGFIAQIREEGSGQVVAVSNASWKCLVIHKAPLNPECVNDLNPIETCTFSSQSEPDGWKDADFDDSGWPNATEHTANAVGPKDGYSDVSWASDAKFVWGTDLKLDNTVLCRALVSGP